MTSNGQRRLWPLMYLPNCSIQGLSSYLYSSNFSFFAIITSSFSLFQVFIHVKEDIRNFYRNSIDYSEIINLYKVNHTKILNYLLKIYDVESQTTWYTCVPKYPRLSQSLHRFILICCCNALTSINHLINSHDWAQQTRWNTNTGYGNICVWPWCMLLQ